ncbi:hypothetical protein IWW45_008376 [Coemansia sp. RSA 485]|nr:hypothetical protein IWW45_008376 [Coemansia sp. RSA 485]
MKTSAIVAIVAAISSSAIATPVGLNIPGIISLDISNGLNLNVLGGLVHANVGGRGERTKKPAPPTVLAPPPVGAPVAPPVFGRHF